MNTYEFSNKFGAENTKAKENARDGGPGGGNGGALPGTAQPAGGVTRERYASFIFHLFHNLHVLASSWKPFHLNEVLWV